MFLDFDFYGGVAGDMEYRSTVKYALSTHAFIDTMMYEEGTHLLY